MERPKKRAAASANAYSPYKNTHEEYSTISRILIAICIMFFIYMIVSYGACLVHLEITHTPIPSYNFWEVICRWLND